MGPYTEAVALRSTVADDGRSSPEFIPGSFVDLPRLRLGPRPQHFEAEAAVAAEAALAGPPAAGVRLRGVGGRRDGRTRRGNFRFGIALS